MINKSIQETIVKILTDEIESIELITLFGSATNLYYKKNKSDIDIAFLALKTVYNLQRWDAQEKLASLLNTDIDLVNLHSCDDIFRFDIISKGQNLFIKPSHKIEYFLDSIYINYIQLNEDRSELIKAYR